jgi:hypothetical protein
MAPAIKAACVASTRLVSAPVRVNQGTGRGGESTQTLGSAPSWRVGLSTKAGARLERSFRYRSAHHHPIHGPSDHEHPYVWHDGAAFYAMRVDIPKAAGLTVEERDRIGPRFARWRPRSDETANAVSCSDHSSRTGADEIQVGRQSDQLDLAKKSPPPTNLQPEPEAAST